MLFVVIMLLVMPPELPYSHPSFDDDGSKVGGSNPTQQVTAGADSSAEDALSHFVTQIYKHSVMF